MSWRDRVLAAVDRQRWLDRAGDAAMQAVARSAFVRPEAARVVPFLRGDWLGHPLHPAPTDVPIGFWSASGLLDPGCESRAPGVLAPAPSAAAARAPPARLA